MFRRVGQFVGKAKGMAREFSSAMNDAADQTGVREMTTDLNKSIKAATNPVGAAMDGVKDAASSLTNFDPESETGKMAADKADAAAGESTEVRATEGEDDEERPKRKRRRGRRGGKRNRRDSKPGEGDENGAVEKDISADAAPVETAASSNGADNSGTEPQVIEIKEPEVPKEVPAATSENDLDEAMVAEAVEVKSAKPVDEGSDGDAADLETAPPPKPSKRGWWQRKSV